jgi:ABC-type molybdate transport system substrate-binding protein
MCAILTCPGETDTMNSPFKLFAMAILLAAASHCACAQELAIFADQTFQPALQEIVPLFTEQTGFQIELSLGRSSILAERIRSGTPADVFFPASEENMRHVMEKGLVDVSLKRNILVMPATEPVEEGIVPEPQFTSAAVMVDSTNRLQAMAFLEFLTSEAARGAFARQGFALP